MRKHGTWALVMAGSLVFLAACSSSQKPQDLRIGIILPLSGDLAQIGASALKSARLAVDDANAGDGVLIGKTPCRVVLVEKDGGTSAEPSLHAAQELITKDRVSAIVSPGLPIPAEAVARLSERSGVPVVIRITTSRSLTRGARYMFRVAYDDETEAAAIVRFLLDRLSLRTAAVLYDASNLGSPTAVQAFRRDYTASGGVLSAVRTYPPGLKSFDPDLAAIRSSRPQCLFLPNYSYDAEVQIGRARALGLAVPIVCSEVMSFAPSRVLAGLEGTWMTAHFDVDSTSDTTRRFVARYLGTFGVPPGPSAALVYDSCSLLIEAARVASSPSSEALAAALRSPRTFHGVTADMSFDGGPDPRIEVPIMRVLGGVLRRVGPD
jgi:branched-chain amino acid transport system substrate-binding protein